MKVAHGFVETKRSQCSTLTTMNPEASLVKQGAEAVSSLDVSLKIIPIAAVINFPPPPHSARLHHPLPRSPPRLHRQTALQQSLPPPRSRYEDHGATRDPGGALPFEMSSRGTRCPDSVLCRRRREHNLHGERTRENGEGCTIGRDQDDGRGCR